MKLEPAALARLLLLNAALVTGFYAAASGPLLRVTAPAVTWGDRALFGGYCLALAAGAMLALLGVLLALATVAPWAARLLATLALAGLLLVVALDARAFTLLGVHLYSPVVTEALRNAEFNREVQLPPSAALLAVGAFALLCGLEALLWAACVRAARAISTGRAALALAIALACGAALTIGFHARTLAVTSTLARVLPLHELFVAGLRRPPELVAEYAYPPSPRLARRPNLLVIAVESWRADALDATLMPNLDRLLRDGTCVRARHHFSSSHATEYGIFSLLYGLDAARFRPFMRRGLQSYPLKVLRDNGYTLAGASASALERWNGAEPIIRQLVPYQEFSSAPPDRRDRSMVDWAHTRRAQLRAPYLLFLFFDSTHIHYAYPPEFERDRPVADENFTGSLSRGDPAPHEKGIINRYRNSVRWVDHLLGELLADFRADAPAVVITGDHGEELWDHGLFGHSAPRFEAARVEVPLVLCLPGAAPPVELSSHVDVMPTLLDHAGGLEADAPLDGRSLLAAPAAPLVVVTAAGFPSENRQLALITPRTKYALVQDAEWIDQFALAQVTDLEDRPTAAPEGELPSLIARFNQRFARYLHAPR